MDIYSQLGVLEEILSEMEAQFVSECMGEVSRLLKFIYSNTIIRRATVLLKKYFEDYIMAVMCRVTTIMEPIHQCVTICLQGSTQRIQWVRPI